MRPLIVLLLLAIPAISQEVSTSQLSAPDAIRIKEFYRLASAIQDGVWADWSKVPAPLMLVTPETEFLTHYPAPPKEFTKVGDDLYARPRQFPVKLQATFPAFGPPSVIVIGEPANTESKTSTPWLFTVMHEHFHQLQNAQPGYFKAVDDLGLSRGDKTGMWMLNYPFPYEKPVVVEAFGHLRDLLLRVMNENDSATFEKVAKEYIEQRKKFFALISADDHKYFSFQLWQEGMARYIEIKSAEAAAQYHPTEEFAALVDFESFASYAAKTRANTLDELKRADLAVWKRLAVYSFGATEGLLLDRIHPSWRDEYFRRMLSTDSYFENAK
jgi:hypothetical protein